MTETTLKTSDLHISAIVQIGKLSSEINLEELVKAILRHNPVKTEEERAKCTQINKTLLYVELGDMNIGSNGKKVPKKIKPKKYFYNQVTLHIYNTKRINTKIFNNGRIQMTGIKLETQGKETIELFLSEVNKFSDESKKLVFGSTVIEQVEPIETVLINSDFDIYNEVNRENLHRLIVENGYYSSYEPCTYPGVNIKYYYNAQKNNFGICDCETPCSGKYIKGKDDACKKITIAVFKSGKIIITGGRTKGNIDSAYKFITEFIHEHKETIVIPMNTGERWSHMFRMIRGKSDIKKEIISKDYRHLF
tara:strand:- start:11873 stop:12793 length:921 start_codon:yes stop_codon:yes gene_type:complete